MLDADGPEGIASLKAFDTLATTWLSHTARGYHEFFRHPGRPIQNRAGLRPGLDVRADGGYVIVPPSLHASGARYEWKTAPGDEHSAQILEAAGLRPSALAPAHRKILGPPRRLPAPAHAGIGRARRLAGNARAAEPRRSPALARGYGLQRERSGMVGSPEPVCVVCGGPRSSRKREACSDPCRTELRRQRKAEPLGQDLLSLRGRIDSLLEGLGCLTIHDPQTRGGEPHDSPR